MDVGRLLHDFSYTCDSLPIHVSPELAGAARFNRFTSIFAYQLFITAKYASFFLLFSFFFHSVTSMPWIEASFDFHFNRVLLLFFFFPTFEKFTEFHPQSDRRRETYGWQLTFTYAFTYAGVALLFKSTDWHTSIPPRSSYRRFRCITIYLSQLSRATRLHVYRNASY